MLLSPVRSIDVIHLHLPYWLKVGVGSKREEQHSVPFITVLAISHSRMNSEHVGATASNSFCTDPLN